MSIVNYVVMLKKSIRIRYFILFINLVKYQTIELDIQK